MRRLFMILLLLIFFTPFKAQAEELIKNGELLTIERCIEIALRIHPTVLAAINTASAYQSKVEQAKSNYYPQISLSSSYSRVSPVSSYSSSYSSSTTSQYLSNTDHSFDQFTGSVALTQNIYDFGKTASDVKVQGLTFESSRFDLNNTEAQVVFNVQQAYYGALKAKRNRAVAEETVRQYEQHLKQARGFYEVGTKPKFDVTKAEVDLSNARLNFIKAENALRIAIVTLNNAVGVPDAPEYTLKDNLSFEKYDITFEKAIGKAYKNRPDLNAAIAKRKAAEESVELAKKGYYPSLTGNAAFTWAGSKLPPENGWNAGTTVSFPIFSGFLTKSQVEGARATMSAQAANEESVRQTVYLDVQQAYLNLKEAEERIPTAELATRQAKENFDIASGRYAAGVGNPIEVTDAEVALSNANAAYIQALYDYKVSRASIEKAIGQRQSDR